jgi:hypothetical protein
LEASEAKPQAMLFELGQHKGVDRRADAIGVLHARLLNGDGLLERPRLGGPQR